ncbi:hypothetical protein GPECTOR_112g270 [Gonium pectorale]|uniref:Protein kinase domain-containing protein n=1 Tax=Gonium pectorale TaxID=33097 RepID=A0A150G0Q7_GONPE|nr:hypothetical protein GPECTOR_112g270 [Gonium pectorale]|eukprot:KXZ42900.1 hypothetical protein GPECTOR_112g270 [Gonium pectorale]
MFSAALRQVAQNVTGLAKQLADEATSIPLGPFANYKFQREYKMGAQTGTAGPHGLWRIFAGTARSSSAVNRAVSIWVLDKKDLAGRGDDLSAGAHGPSGAAAWQQRWEGVLQQQRRGCALMTRLKHPGVVRVVLPLEETAAHPQHPPQGHGHFGGSGSGSSSEHAASPSAPAAPQSPSLSLLEVKLGLLQLVEVLTFLHGTAHTAHCGLSPQTVVVAADGGWKLAGFAFAATLPGAGPGAGAGSADAAPPPGPPYQYNDPFPPLWEELSKPQLPYTAPELVIPPGGVPLASPLAAAAAAGAASSWAPADSFSLGALVYELVLAAEAGEAGGGGGGGGGVQQYGSRLAALGAAVAAAGGGGGGWDGGGGGAASVDMARVPAELRGPLLALVAPPPAARPPPAALARCAWFEGDTLLRALRFLEGMMQSEPRHKLAFLADFADESPAGAPGAAAPSSSPAPGGGGSPPERALWRRMGDRLLLSRVLPHLLQEVRNGGPVGVAALPVALAVCRRLGRAAFAERALPALEPVVEAAGGPGATGAAAGGGGSMLAALVGQSEVMAGLMDGPTIDRLLLPMLLRALLGPGGVAGAALTRLQSLVASGLLDGRAQQVRAALLPALRASASRTTSAAVRVASLGLMAAMGSRVDRAEGEAILAMCAQLLSVDGSGATAAAVAALFEALAAAPGWGCAAAAARMLPLMSPQLLSPGLTPQQLAAVAAAMQRMLSLVVRHAEDAAQGRGAGGAASPRAAALSATGGGGGASGGPSAGMGRDSAASAATTATTHGSVGAGPGSYGAVGSSSGMVLGGNGGGASAGGFLAPVPSAGSRPAVVDPSTAPAASMGPLADLSDPFAYLAPLAPVPGGGGVGGGGVVPMYGSQPTASAAMGVATASRAGGGGVGAALPPGLGSAAASPVGAAAAGGGGGGGTGRAGGADASFGWLAGSGTGVAATTGAAWGGGAAPGAGAMNGLRAASPAAASPSGPVNLMDL